MSVDSAYLDLDLPIGTEVTKGVHVPLDRDTRQGHGGEARGADGFESATGLLRLSKPFEHPLRWLGLAVSLEGRAQDLNVLEKNVSAYSSTKKERRTNLKYKSFRTSFIVLLR